MKKFLAIAFTSIMIFCLAACGGSDNPNSRPSPDDAYVPDPSNPFRDTNFCPLKTSVSPVFKYV